MPSHEIIDNRTVKLADNINRILGTSEAARFAVGYLFLSGLEAIGAQLSGLKELRLLIGNTTNRDTLEQLAEWHRHLAPVTDEAEAQAYPRRADARKMSAETAENIRSTVELMDQSDEAEQLLRTLADMIQQRRLKVRVYVKGRMHAKAYIFDYGRVFDLLGRPVARHEDGIAIIGSSNLTLSGITHNTELNVVVQGNDNHAELVRWFDELWDESQDFDDALMTELGQSWAMAPITPYDVYMKTLYTLVKDRLQGDDPGEVLWDDEITRKLADFQKVAVRQAVQIINDYGGGFVSDVVGLGKSFIGAAVVKHFERIQRARPLIICPAPLVEMWEGYNEVYELNARVLSMGFLREENGNGLASKLDDPKYRDRDFLLIDESHNLRHPDTQRYRVVQSFLASGKRCCFITATPRNKSAWDVYNQIKLFHQEDKTDLPVDPPNLREYFKLIDQKKRNLPDILAKVLIRRTRNHILRWYGYDSETHEKVDPSRFREYLDGRRRAYVMVGGKHQFFPRRELETIEYSIEDTYRGLYQQLRGYLGKPAKGQPKKPRPDELTYARYGLWHYVVKDRQQREPYVSLHRAGFNLRGLVRVLLFKRFESSVYAFKETIRRLLKVHELFLAALQRGIVPAGEDAQTLLYEAGDAEEGALMEELREASRTYDAADFDLERLKGHIEHDVELLKKILALVEPITPAHDAKLQTLLRWLSREPLSEGKRLIFTQYADTARYLYDNLNPGGALPDVEVIFSGDKSKARVVGRFAPKANPEYRRAPGESEITTLVATDVLAEGLNLQDCDKIVNYDLHWNPVRLIQRFGRIDRIGSEHDVVYGFNFLPETGLERNLGLRQKLHNRIQEIHDTIGEDALILDRTEQLNEDALYAVYEKNGGQLSLFEDEEEEFVDLNEAEEILRLLKKEDPAEYERIAGLRDGIRSAKASSTRGSYLLCQAGRYLQLFLLDEQGEVVSRDLPRVLGTVKCGPDVPVAPLPKGYNASVTRVKRVFEEEVKRRQSELEHGVNLKPGQKYVIRELRTLFKVSDDEDEKERINVLEQAFRKHSSTPIDKELNRLRRNGVTGPALLKGLQGIYLEHGMQDWSQRRGPGEDEMPIPRIVCSEALV